ncbi:hypothetical protein scyTo_0008639 [Scyliorhinus torazame]|uniref:VWFD domain-containing protein n=1 Tax=Scyliorhinus torazame TaxID=75743 RepID=A0A401PC41_SCYTO|nr:hypothetical protein [Scyliorhinus torazame]
MSIDETSERKSNRIIRQKRDIISQGEQTLQSPAVPSFLFGTTASAWRSAPLLGASKTRCSLPCLNAGICINVDQCDCTEFEANGTRCQTVPNRGSGRDLICRTWGQHNYETFDGLYYYYPGNCTYTLVRECKQSQQSFAIQLPYIIGNLKFEQIAGYILVRHHHGFSLAWDGGSGIYIKMNMDYVGKICGLCGNFNGNMHDDMYTSYGLLTEDIAIFGNSWKEDMPDKKPCHIIPVSYPAPSDRPLHDWRQLFNQCVAICEDEFVHQECIDCCPMSCGLEQECVGSDFQCLDGCYCPQGLIHENGTCLNRIECPCMFQGIPYTSGSVIQEHCTYCICIGGIWNCTKNNCPAECSVTGDIYFKTFDERVYTFHATCQYILAKSHNSGKFTISLQNSQCGSNLNGACIQSVSLVVDEDAKKQVTLTRSGEVYHSNQYRISLPYRDGMK